MLVTLARRAHRDIHQTVAPLLVLMLHAINRAPVHVHNRHVHRQHTLAVMAARQHLGHSIMVVRAVHHLQHVH